MVEMFGSITGQYFKDGANVETPDTIMVLGVTLGSTLTLHITIQLKKVYTKASSLRHIRQFYR